MQKYICVFYCPSKIDRINYLLTLTPNRIAAVLLVRFSSFKNLNNNTNLCSGRCGYLWSGNLLFFCTYHIGQLWLCELFFFLIFFKTRYVFLINRTLVLYKLSKTSLNKDYECSYKYIDFHLTSSTEHANIEEIKSYLTTCLVSSSKVHVCYVPSDIWAVIYWYRKISAHTNRKNNWNKI